MENNKGINSPGSLWLDDIVPIAVKLISLHMDSLHFLICDSASGGILPTVQSASHFQSFRSSGFSDEMHNRLIVPQRLPPPVGGDKGKTALRCFEWVGLRGDELV